MRYEAHLAREFVRTLDQLEKARALKGRVGVSVPDTAAFFADRLVPHGTLYRRAADGVLGRGTPQLAIHAIIGAGLERYEINSQ